MCRRQAFFGRRSYQRAISFKLYKGEDMYKALYRAYRPEVFDEVIGQDHIVRILKNQISQGTVSHAYLFCGTRGTGKTTTARLLAKAVNCTGEGEKPCGRCDNCMAIKNGNFVDLIEVDAASTNGVDDIRSLRESVNYPPAVGRKKVYIIDEVHMLSSSAFNALLKTLEEPPEAVMFILCTTEPEKLLPTVLSRCMRMDFRRVPEDSLLERLKKICGEVGAEIDDDALRLIAVNADGSARDGITLLDQCISGRQGHISREDVLDSLGAVDVDTYIEMTQKTEARDVAGGLLMIDGLIRAGKDARQILQGWMGHYRNLLMATFIDSPKDMLGMSEENAARVSAQAAGMHLDVINNAIIEIAKTAQVARMSTQPRILLEMCFVQLATYSSDGAKVILKTSAKKPGRAPKAHVQEQNQTKTEQADQAPPDFSTESFADDADISAAHSEQTTLEAAEQSDDDRDAEVVGADMDIASVWEDVVREAIERSDSHTIGLLKNTEALSMDETTVTVSGSRMAATTLDSNRQFIENILEQHSGSRRHIVVTDGEPEEKQETFTDMDLQRTSESAEGFLGIPVEIENK